MHFSPTATIAERLPAPPPRAIVPTRITQILIALLAGGDSRFLPAVLTPGKTAGMCDLLCEALDRSEVQ